MQEDRQPRDGCSVEVSILLQIFYRVLSRYEKTFDSDYLSLFLYEDTRQRSGQGCWYKAQFTRHIWLTGTV